MTDGNQINASQDTRAKAEAFFGSVEWLDDNEGLVHCPGEAAHTAHNGKRDCMLYLTPVPTLTCFHASCRDAVEAKNKELRRALAGAADLNAKPRKVSAEEKARIAEWKRKEDIRRRAANSKELILREWAWPYADILAQSPTKLPDNHSADWRSLMGLFNDADVIWTGDIYDSGKEEHADRFRTKEQWLQLDYAPGQFTCPATFKSGSFARSNENVVARRFLVVESDELTRDQVGGIFRWLSEKVRLNLRAIVDTAGKSLHAWFDYPAQDVVGDLKLVLPQLGCDPKLFTTSQPVRLPGALRDGKYQRLVWLGKGGAR